jgi:hypothetical protein
MKNFKSLIRKTIILAFSAVFYIETDYRISSNKRTLSNKRTGVSLYKAKKIKNGS